jgi:putative ABC transport system permease protein
MSKLSEIWRRVQMLVRREKFARELEEEMRLHRELKEKELIADGVEEREARYAANRQFGNAMYFRERSSETWAWRWLEDFVQDLRFGARMLGKNPGFTIAAVVTLAVGIGANTAIFSVVNAVLLRPLPYHDPARLVRADEYWPRINDKVVPGPDYTNWKLNNHDFEGLAAFDSGDQINLTSVGQPERIESVLVTANFLRVLGVQPSLGRDFRREEAERGAKLVAILSDGLWRRKFAAEPHVLGKSIALNAQSYTVIGVMPEGFSFPDRRANPEILLAFQLPPKVDWTAQSVSLTRVIGRLKSDVSITQANMELATLSKRTEADIPAAFLHMRDGMQVRTTGLHEKLVGDIRLTLLILLAAVAFVLLIGCLNVANLQLARASSRQKELALRAAIGAGRTRLLRQLLTEAVVLAALGGLAALLIAAGGVRLLRDYAPASFLQAGHIELDKWVLLFTFGITFVTALLFGAVPALRASNPDVNTDLKEGRSLPWRGYTQSKLRAALVTCELTLAVVLLVASGLLIRSLVRLSNVDPGFDATNLLTISTALPESKYRQPAQRTAFFERVLREVTRLPGVRSAALTSSLPLTHYSQGSALSVEGRPDPSTGARPLVPIQHVSRAYFATLRVPLREGRLFDEGDFTPRAEHVVVANRAFVQRYFLNDDPLGKRIRLGDPNSQWRTIVGVVGDVRHVSLSLEADAEVYVPYAGQDATSTAMLAVRTYADPRNLATAVREVVMALDAEQPVFAISTMEQRITDSMSGTRFNARLLGIFGFVALALASVGVYGVVAYFVAQRIREIGIRVALGASSQDVMGMVMRQGTVMTLAGLALGLGGAMFATRYLASLLYGISASDPLTLASAAITLGAVALAACYVPARRATRVDPLVALRYE